MLVGLGRSPAGVVRPKSYRFSRTDVGRAILPAAGLPAGWTRWKAGPQAAKPALPFRRVLVIVDAALHYPRATWTRRWSPFDRNLV